MSNEKTQKLAEKIANLLDNDSQASDLHSIQESIGKINDRLDSIEGKLNKNTHHLPLTTHHSNHPSLDKYDVIEAIVDEVFENQDAQKTCTFEPNGKPCDHCSMCSSRGF